MSTQPLTVQQFAALLKERIPQLQGADDDELVRKVLARRPELITKLSSPPAGPSREMHGRPEDFTTRVIDRLGSNLKSAVDMPGNIAQESRRRFLELHPENAKQSTLERLKDFPLNVPDAVRSAFDAVQSQALTPTAKGVYSVTPPSLVGRMVEGEDPANLTGDALMFFGGEDLGKGTHEVVDPTKSPRLTGSKTRGIALMDSLDKTAKDIPIEHGSTYSWVQKALALEKYGWKAPPWMHAYADMIEAGTKGGKEPIPGRPGEFIDRPGSMNPLTYEHARNFESIAGATIDWDDPGGKMNALQKKAREALGKDIAAGLKPYGLDTPYLRAKSEFTRAYGAEAKWGPYGYFGGKFAGYGVGAVTGHPLMTGYLGGKVGQSAAGQLVKSLTEAGEPEIEQATRRGATTAGIPPLDRLRMATDRLNLLRDRAAKNPGDYHAVTELRVAEDAVAQATKDVWGPKYAGTPKTTSAQGGGGANYTAEQLAEFKKRNKIQ